MNLDAILIVNGEETHPEAPGFLSRTQAAFRAYEQNPTFIVTPTDVSRDYLLFSGVDTGHLIEEQGGFRNFLIDMDADPEHYAGKNSCDAYTSLLFGIYSTKDLLETETLGIATDANLTVPHTKLAELLATSDIIDVPSNYLVSRKEQESAKMQLESLREDMKRFKVRKEDFLGNCELLRRHPEIAQCYGETPRGSYSMLRSLEKTFK